MARIKTKDRVINKLLVLLKKEHHCHAVILYGSHARGDANTKSDYDLAGFGNVKLRIAKKIYGKYADIVIFPDRNLRDINEAHLQLNGGKLLFDKAGFGKKVLEKVKRIGNQNPTPLSKNESQFMKVWAYKMFERSMGNDVESAYRRTWLVTSLLEDYFRLRNKRYLGPKQSFSWLKKFDKRTFKQFEMVLLGPSASTPLKKLVDRVVGNIKPLSKSNRIL